MGCSSSLARPATYICVSAIVGYVIEVLLELAATVYSPTDPIATLNGPDRHDH